MSMSWALENDESASIDIMETAISFALIHIIFLSCGGGFRFLYYLFVKGDILRDDLVGRVSLDSKLAAFFAKRAAEIFVTKQNERIRTHLLNIAYIAQKAGF